MAALDKPDLLAEAAAVPPDEQAERLAPLIELGSTVEPDDEALIRALVETALDRAVAALRVPPAAVSAVRAVPGGADLRLVTLLDSDGSLAPDTLASEVEAAVRARVDEIDLGLPVAEVLAGDHGLVPERLQAARVSAGTTPLGLVLSARALGSPVDLTAVARGAIMGGASHLITDAGRAASELEAIATVLAVLEEADGRIGLKVPGGPDMEQAGASLLHLVDHFLGPTFASPASLRLVLET